MYSGWYWAASAIHIVFLVCILARSCATLVFTGYPERYLMFMLMKYFIIVARAGQAGVQTWIDSTLLYIVSLLRPPFKALKTTLLLAKRCAFIHVSVQIHIAKHVPVKHVQGCVQECICVCRELCCMHGRLSNDHVCSPVSQRIVHIQRCPFTSPRASELNVR